MIVARQINLHKTDPPQLADLLLVVLSSFSDRWIRQIATNSWPAGINAKMQDLNYLKRARTRAIWHRVLNKFTLASSKTVWNFYTSCAKMSQHVNRAAQCKRHGSYWVFRLVFLEILTLQVRLSNRNWNRGTVVSLSGLSCSGCFNSLKFSTSFEHLKYPNAYHSN
jgi:hypothetical protein